MDKLKIWFADFCPEWKDEDFITPILKNHFGIVLDRNNPDVVFHSIFNRMEEVAKYKCKKILYLGENHRPEQFGSDYSISFDPHTEKNFSLPLWQVYLLNKPSLKSQLFLMNRFKEDHERWCAFTVSNSNNFMRNSFYHQLNGYKMVHSYGRYLTNDTGLINFSEGKYWRDAKEEFFKEHSHKFIMAIENSPYKYYCTEKLMDAFLGYGLPIYWGDTRVKEGWNEKAFINGTKLNILDEVKRIDADPGLYKAMMMEPIFTEEQMHNLEQNISYFEEWLIEKIEK
jgi:hypothetical protein